MSLLIKGKKIWIAGHHGMVGQALCRRFMREDVELLTVSKSKLDLRDQTAVKAWMQDHKPDIILMAAGRVGGILDNQLYPAQYLFDNLAIAQNIIDNAHHMGVEKLVYLGSSCIYPKNAVNPITEDSLLTGALEPTNEAYAIAKIAGIKLCQAYRAQHNCNFISVMPCNLYGQYDRFESERSHVIPAMMLNMHKAMHSGEKEVLIWGSGVPRREFLHVDDLADAVHLALLKYDDAAPLNIGAGYDLPIGDLAALIKAVVGYQGVLKFDRSKPDGTAQKLMDSSRIRALGWMPQIGLSEGLNQTYQWFNRSHSSSRMVA